MFIHFHLLHTGGLQALTTPFQCLPKTTPLAIFQCRPEQSPQGASMRKWLDMPSNFQLYDVLDSMNSITNFQQHSTGCVGCIEHSLKKHDVVFEETEVA